MSGSNVVQYFRDHILYPTEDSIGMVSNPVELRCFNGVAGPLSDSVHDGVHMPTYAAVRNHYIRIMGMR